MPETEARIAALADKTLLLLDDDNALRTRLGRALESRGFEVTTAASVAEAREALRASAPAFAVLDMRLEDGNGLKVVEAIRDRREDSRIVMLTGYGAIATAVAAVTTSNPRLSSARPRRVRRALSSSSNRRVLSARAAIRSSVSGIIVLLDSKSVTPPLRSRFRVGVRHHDGGSSSAGRGQRIDTRAPFG